MYSIRSYKERYLVINVLIYLMTFLPNGVHVSSGVYVIDRRQFGGIGSLFLPCVFQ